MSATRHPTATFLRRIVRRLSRWAWTVPGSVCTCPFPRYADDCPRHRTRSGPSRIRTIATAAFVEGARVEVESLNGWLQLKITTDDSIVGWALTIDGKDYPTTDDALRLRVLDLEGALRAASRPAADTGGAS